MIRMKSSAFIVAALALIVMASCNSGGGNSYPSGPGNGGSGRELNSGDFGPGATFQHRFASAGTFHYHCAYHPAMPGQVMVSAAAPDTLVNVNITSSTSPFPEASVKPGGRVVWTNNTNMVHTVTSD